MANKGWKNLDEHRQATQFTSGGKAVAAGRKGGKASAVAKRKKYASRQFLKEVLAMDAKMTPEIKKALMQIGADPDIQLTNEQVGVIALIRKWRNGDLRAFDMVHEYLAEDPHTILEEKRIKAAQQAFAAVRNSDGFMEAMNGTTEEVFEDGGDTPDTLEDD